MACYGSTRATVDLDLLIREENKQKVTGLFVKNGFNLVNESQEDLQFSGLGYVDVLLARSTISQKIQAYCNDSSRELQDKADIEFLLENVTDLDWERIKVYADLFDQWEVINGIKNKIKS